MSRKHTARRKARIEQARKAEHDKAVKGKPKHSRYALKVQRRRRDAKRLGLDKATLYPVMNALMEGE